MSNKPIATIEEFEELFNKHDEFLFMKNSLTCPISQAAYEEFIDFTEKHQDYPSYHLHVQEARPLSNYIAETYHIKHESPQALLFKGKEVKWNASHWKITYDALKKETAQ
ncbi:bacillithiol system redox-active protein YtxJ [Metabacillus niabensis]|uniref:Bacillithiol system protein YtxJ n=1 Tax=Metabacillus niabensis TaxID=324854 RepID=A0ABT9YZ24_9BACI|nr:bacillithiol system redox-active protein YtxJ [Metabacillus niabensis]MDQ0224568.1 bacillithiol system protein YtxJ [Metabacillus niabensis]PAD66142.1 thioredoxin family protein [Bacillus sp. 7586-K]